VGDLFEIVGNFHLHTDHTDGAGTHQEVARAASQAGLDVIAYTDHNCWTAGQEGWYTHPGTGRRVLLLMGEEVHDEECSPEVNHYLCLGADRELRQYAPRRQALVDAVNQHGGVGFIAHPVEEPAPLFGQPALPWLDWGVTGFAGIELWNYMSEFKSYLTSRPAAVLVAYFPGLFISGPSREMLALWDNLLRGGRPVAAIGGADAHASVYRMGPLRRAVLPYAYLFRAVNTHLLLDAPLSHDPAAAKAQVLSALRAGHAFVSYDLAGECRGFRFTAAGRHGNVSMGDEIHLDGPITLHASAPLPADIRLIKDGNQVARVRGRELNYETRQAGVFRIEMYRRYRVKRRGWVFSNPIYVRGQA
jgi:hypothetical protein